MTNSSELARRILKRMETQADNTPMLTWEQYFKLAQKPESEWTPDDRQRLVSTMAYIDRCNEPYGVAFAGDDSGQPASDAFR